MPRLIRKRIPLEEAIVEVAPPEVAPTPEIKVEFKPLYDILAEIYGKISELAEKIDKLTLPEVRTYYSDEGSVNKANPKTYNFKEELGRNSVSGYIINDGDQDIKIRINGGPEITVKSGEERTWGPNEAIKLIVEKIEIKTDAATNQNYRLYAE